MRKLCVFDLDGTLADSINSIAYFANLTIQKYGIEPVETEHFKKFVGDGAAKLIERLLKFRNVYPENYEKILREYNKSYDEDFLYLCKPYDGISDLLYNLKQSGIRISVLSNKPHSTTIKIVHALYGEDIFSNIYGQRENIALKPDPEALLSILEELKIKSEECVYIGDTKTDMMTGKNAGVFTVGVLWGFRDKTELTEYKADAIVSKPLEILDYVLAV